MCKERRSQAQQGLEVCNVQEDTGKVLNEFSRNLSNETFRTKTINFQLQTILRIIITKDMLNLSPTMA